MYIELSLDLIRKGIQQENIVQVSSVFATQVATKSAIITNKESLSQKFQSIFDNASQRPFQLSKNNFSKSASGKIRSNMWDFDILSPKIEIRDDSAFVECQLVLWGAGSEGLKVSERFVFFAPQKVKPTVVEEGYHEWGSIKKLDRKSPKAGGWALVSCENLFSFLEDFGDKSVQIEKSGGGQK